jgi:ribosomal-protein-alanine N-acetyltransferase
MPPLFQPVVAPGALADRDQPTLSGNDVVLRPFKRSDAPLLVSAYSEPGIQHWHGASLTDREANDWIEARPDLWRREARADWAVTVNAAVVGRIGLKAIDLEEGMAEVAYWIVAEHRRNGYATSAVTVLSDWAFSDLGLHRLELTHSTRNQPSCGVAERAGYQLEGTKRDGGMHPDGWHDLHLHARIATDPASDLRPSPPQ